MTLRSRQSYGSIFSFSISLFLSLTHLIGSRVIKKFESSRETSAVCQEWLLRRGLSRSRADKCHPETLGRRGRRSVTGETHDHPLPPQFVRTAIPSTSRFLFHPPAPSLSRHSATPACASLLLFLRRSISESTSIHFPSFSLLSCSFYLSSLVSCVFLLHPLRFFVLSLSIFLPRSFFLLYRSIYPYLLLSLSLSLCRTLAFLPTCLVARVSFCPSATLQTLARRAVTWTSARPIVRRVTSSA